MPVFDEAFASLTVLQVTKASAATDFPMEGSNAPMRVYSEGLLALNGNFAASAAVPATFALTASLARRALSSGFRDGPLTVARADVFLDALVLKGPLEDFDFAIDHRNIKRGGVQIRSDQGEPKCYAVVSVYADKNGQVFLTRSRSWNA
jgi:hypothetical protein